MSKPKYSSEFKIMVADVSLNGEGGFQCTEEKQWSINWMCRQLNISRAAYCKWLRRSIPEQEYENIKLAELIKEYDERFVSALFLICMTVSLYEKPIFHSDRGYQGIPGYASKTGNGAVHVPCRLLH